MSCEHRKFKINCSETQQNKSLAKHFKIDVNDARRSKNINSSRESVFAVRGTTIARGIKVIVLVFPHEMQVMKVVQAAISQLSFLLAV